EDALQEGFARALVALPSFRGDAPLGAWVWRIAVRVALEQGRAGARRSEVEERAADSEAQLVESGHDPRLAAALRGLPQQRRLIRPPPTPAPCSDANSAPIWTTRKGTAPAPLPQGRGATAEALGAPQPATSQPATSQPATTQPPTTQPVTTQPVTTQRGT